MAAPLTLACSARSTSGGLPDGSPTFETDSGTGATASVCNQYCAVATAACPTYAMGDCVSNCATQYSRLTPACQATATTFFRCAFSQQVTCGRAGRPSLPMNACQDELLPFFACISASVDGGA